MTGGVTTKDGLQEEDKIHARDISPTRRYVIMMQTDQRVVTQSLYAVEPSS